MLIKTHLVITLFFVMLFLSFVENKIIFVVVALLATFIADVDHKHSMLGKKKIFRPLQFFIRHRTFFHSFLFLMFIILILILFIPVLAFPFFLGYGLHLFADSFTLRGIRPFYPMKGLAHGGLRTGSRRETMIFVIFLVLNIFMILLKFNQGYF